MAVCSWLEGMVSLRVGWSTAETTSGHLSVPLAGTTLMPRLFAGSWDLVSALVHCNCWCLLHDFVG